MAKPASAEQKAATADQRRMEQALEREKAARVKANLAGLWSRRDVFGRFGWAIFGAFSRHLAPRLRALGIPARALRAAHLVQGRASRPTTPSAR